MSHDLNPAGTAGRGVLDGAFRLLRALPDAPVDGQVSALSRMTDIPRSSVHRLLGQLEEIGVVEYHGGRYLLAADLVRMANRVEPVAGLREVSAGIIQSVREQTGAAVSLVVPGARAPVALRIVPGREDLPFDVYDGIEMPSTSAAAVVLDPRSEPGRFDRRHGAAVDEQHCFAGMTCYAVRIPLADPTDAAVLQVASAGTRSIARLAPFVHRAARAIGDELAKASPRSPVTSTAP